MENEEKEVDIGKTVDGAVYNIYSKARRFIAGAIGIGITVLCAAGIFVIAALEGTKEVKASNSDSGKILNIWREANGGQVGDFPEEKAEIVEYKNREYYFVVESRDAETGAITDWYFAFDGGIDYVLQDPKFYVLTGLAISFAFYTSQTNYRQSVKSAMSSPSFTRTLNYYQVKKESVQSFTQFIPDFCIFKNKEAYENAKRSVIEDAGLNYDFYNSAAFDFNKLAKWQIKKLKKLEKIKIKKLHSSDLLQEGGKQTATTISLLPMGQAEHERRFMLTSLSQKIVTTFLSGLVMAFGIILGNWILGVTFSITIFLSAITAIVIGADYTNSTLRNRYIAKADFLNEFNNVKNNFIKIEKIDSKPKENSDITILKPE